MNNSEIDKTCLKLNKMSIKNEGKSFKEQEPETQEKNNMTLKSGTSSNLHGSLKEITCDTEFTFDNVVGCLEDMLVDEEFQDLQKSFLEKYWKEFDATEENKHSYIPIFNEYTIKNENFIAEYLKQRIVNFKMEEFLSDLEQRKNTLEGEIFEVLLTLTDFKAFKEIFLDYRAMKEGRTIDLGQSLYISPIHFR